MPLCKPRYGKPHNTHLFLMMVVSLSAHYVQIAPEENNKLRRWAELQNYNMRRCSNYTIACNEYPEPTHANAEYVHTKIFAAAVFSFLKLTRFCGSLSFKLARGHSCYSLEQLSTFLVPENRSKSDPGQASAILS